MPRSIGRLLPSVACEILRDGVREWLRGRRNALVDAALVYLAAEWVGPFLVSAVVSLASSPNGGYMLFFIGWPLFVATSLAVGRALGMSLPQNPHHRPGLLMWGRFY
jgi:hypothetical protein